VSPLDRYPSKREEAFNKPLFDSGVIRYRNLFPPRQNPEDNHPPHPSPCFVWTRFLTFCDFGIQPVPPSSYRRFGRFRRAHTLLTSRGLPHPSELRLPPPTLEPFFFGSIFPPRFQLVYERSYSFRFIHRASESSPPPEHDPLSINFFFAFSGAFCYLPKRPPFFFRGFVANTLATS